MASKLILKEINEKYAAEKYIEAVELCDQGLKSNDQVFILWAMKGYCFVSLNRLVEAEIALKKASLFPGTPENQPQMQRIWKELSQIYMTSKKWSESIAANINLAEIVKSKGNMERYFVLIENIIDACDLVEIPEVSSLLYLVHFVRTYNTENISLSFKILSKFLMWINKCCKIDKKGVSLGTTQKIWSDDIILMQKRSDINELLYIILSTFSIILIRENGTILDNYTEEQIGNVLSLIQLCLNLFRYHVLSKEKSWDDLFQATINISNKLSSIYKERLCIGFLAESWFFSDEISYAEISPEIDAILEFNSSNSTALLVKCQYYTSLGLWFTIKEDLNSLSAQWREISGPFEFPVEIIFPNPAENHLFFDTTAKSSQEIVLQFLSLIVSLSGLSFLEFRGFTDNILSSISYRAIKLLPTVRKISGTLREELDTAIPLIRIQSLAHIRQYSAAQRESIAVLPSLFPSSLPCTPNLEKALLGFKKVSIQWSFVRVLIGLNFYQEAMSYLDQILKRNPSSVSWILLERAWIQLLLIVDKVLEENKQIKLWRDIDLSHSHVDEITSIIQQLQSVIEHNDIVSKDIATLLDLRLGIAHWLAGGTWRSKKTGCLSFLLSAAKRDTHDHRIYSFLGHYYYIHLKDKERGVRLYIKALGMQFSDMEAGISCSQLYLDNNQPEKALKLWGDIHLKSPQSFWMHATKGQYHLGVNELQEAVVQFQYALEIQDKDLSCWVGLALSYNALRQDTAALKTLLAAYELDPSNSIILCTIGDVERRLGQITSAISRYKQVLLVESNNITALRGLGDSYLALAFQDFTIGWTSGAAANIMEGAKYVEEAVKIKKCRSLWKLLGDLYCFSCNLSSYDFNRKDLLLDYPDYTMQFLYLQKAEEAYTKLLSFESDIEKKEYGDVYYDIGNSIYQLAVLVLQSKGQGSGLIATHTLCTLPDISALLSRTKDAFLKGIRANPLHAKCWCGLGLSFMNDIGKQQACFARSIQIEPNAQAFANLAGSAVFTANDVVAREAYTALQQIESNPIFWLGLANIFERGEGTTETIFDAYASAIEISKPSEAIIGQAIAWLRSTGLWITTSPTSLQVTTIDILHNVEHPLKAYLRRRPQHPVAWLLYAWAVQFRGDVGMAKLALSRAVCIADYIRNNLKNISDNTVDIRNIESFMEAIKFIEISRSE